MKRKLIAGSVAALAVASGTAGAIAATSNDKQDEKAVLSAAAKTLGVGTDELRSALSSAENAQLAAAVKAGKITQAQADAIKQRRQADGTVLGLGHDGGHGGFGHHGGGRELLAAAAKAIGISETKLTTQLRAGKTLEAVAKANGKTLAEVKAAAKKAATAQLDADLKAGTITQSEYDEEVSELDDEITNLGTFGDHGGHGFGRP